jgi:hypothetical protein
MSVMAKVSGVPANVLFDTGSQGNFLSTELVTQAGFGSKLIAISGAVGLTSPLPLMARCNHRPG